MGRGDCAYLFRHCAEQDAIWPSEMELPRQVRNVAENDTLLDTMVYTNFNGSATHVNHALNVTTRDIENLRRNEDWEAGILPVTDGKAEILRSTHTRLVGAGIDVHTIMMASDRNDSMQAISEGFTARDINPDLPSVGKPTAVVVTDARARARTAHHI